MEELDPAQRDALESMTKALVKRMLHGQIQLVRAAARSGDEAKLEVIKDLWSDDE